MSDSDEGAVTSAVAQTLVISNDRPSSHLMPERLWAPALDSGPQPPQPLHRQPRKNAGEHIIEHDADPAMYVLVDPVNGPGLEDVEKAEDQKTHQQPDPALGH